MRAGRAERRGLPQSGLAHGGKIDGGSQRAELFVRADVGRGLFPADVLLPRGKREDIAGLPLRVVRLTDDAAGELTHHGARRGHKAEVRAAEGRVEAKGLTFADGDVRAALAGRFQNCQRNGVHTHDVFGPGCVRDLAEQLRVLQQAEEIRLLDIEAGGIRTEYGAQRVRVCSAVLHRDDS